MESYSTIENCPKNILTQILGILRIEKRNLLVPKNRMGMVHLLKTISCDEITSRKSDHVTMRQIKNIASLVGISKSGNRETLMSRFNEWRGYTPSINKKTSNKIIIIESEFPEVSKKQYIPKPLRDTVFSIYCQSYDNAYCYVGCREKISPFNFECGYIISPKNGGITNVDNLRPICGHCSKLMGSKNMHEFIVEKKYVDNTKRIQISNNVHI